MKHDRRAQTAPDDFEARLGLDPLIIEAKADVDETLFEWTLPLGAFARLQQATQHMRTLARFRRVGSPTDR